MVWTPWAKRNAQVTASDLLGWQTAARSGRGPLGGTNISRDQALRHSAYWACLRLRADLVSTMPIDVFRRVGGIQVEMPKPPVLQMPGGSNCEIEEWLYSTQVDLDSTGNTFGIIKARDGQSLPALIELLPVTDVVVSIRGGEMQVRVAGELIDPMNLWHEKQFTSSGIPVGLSPTASGAASIRGYLSAQQFAADWFAGGATPAAQLKNTSKKLDPDEARKVKDRFRAAVDTGDVFVTGSDWDYSMLSAKASEAMFLDERRFGLGDVCRFLGVPGDMIDAAPDGTAITYANITQRNLQLLIMNLGPAITRREAAFSRRMLPQPRYVKFNTDALLRMDLASRYAGYKLAVDSRFMTPDEIRELENRPPLTPEQEAAFARLFPWKSPGIEPTGAPA